MPDYPPGDLGDAQWARAQGALIDFLHADLDLAFTWLRTAAIDERDDPKGCELTNWSRKVAAGESMRITLKIVGFVLVVFGGIWFPASIGVLPGSLMTGHSVRRHRGSGTKSLSLGWITAYRKKPKY